MIHLVFKKCFYLYDKRLCGIVHYKLFDYLLKYVHTIISYIHNNQQIKIKIKFYLLYNFNLSSNEK